MDNTDELYNYEQKKINHVFHYTPVFEHLQGIVSKGFLPSYCKEKIGETNYLTPMVSFCNIPMVEVDKYMRYGKNGIGMSLSWAVQNRLTPVTYIHRNSPYHSVLKSIDFIQSKFSFGDRKEIKIEDFINNDEMLDKAMNIEEINIISLITLQYLKNWETFYDGDKIKTYQEREWRYVPTDSKIKPIIQENESQFFEFEEKPKPHFPECSLKINEIDDISYIVVTEDSQRAKIIKTLNKRFSKNKTKDAIMSGKLLILTANQIKNDF